MELIATRQIERLVDLRQKAREMDERAARAERRGDRRAAEDYRTEARLCRWALDRITEAN